MIWNSQQKHLTSLATWCYVLVNISLIVVLFIYKSPRFPSVDEVKHVTTTLHTSLSRATSSVTQPSSRRSSTCPLHVFLDLPGGSCSGISILHTFSRGSSSDLLVTCPNQFKPTNADFFTSSPWHHPATIWRGREEDVGGRLRWSPGGCLLGGRRGSPEAPRIDLAWWWRAK